MPYSSTQDLPANVKKLPGRKQRIWRRVFNSEYNQQISNGKSKDEAESIAFAAAWSVVNRGHKKFIEALDAGEDLGMTRQELDTLLVKYPDEPITGASLTLGGAMDQGAQLISTPQLQEDFRIFIPFSKVDKDKREVIGIATAEFLDSQGEVLSYEGSKEAVKNWVGNVREQHDPLKAVGKRMAVEFDDTNRTVQVRSRISKGAPDTWEKVLDETLIGYSIGGKRVETTIKNADECPEHVFQTLRGKKPQKVRWTSRWDMGELSLVDSPALSVAKIQLVKSEDGELMLTDVTGDTEAVETGGAPSGGETKVPDTAKSDAPPVSDPAIANESDTTAQSAGTFPAPAVEPGATKAGDSVPPGTPPATPGDAEKAEWTAAMMNDLPDSCFAYVETGEKDEDGKTTPCSKRHYPIKDASGKCDAAHTRNAMTRASQAKEKGGDAAAIASKALPKIRACAKKLKIGEFKSDTGKFLQFHNVFAVSYGDGDEIESESPLVRSEVMEFIGQHQDAPILKFTIKPRTFGEVLADYRANAAWREFWEVLDMLPHVLGNILLDSDLSLDEKRSLIDQSFDEFSDAIFEELAGVQPGTSKSSPAPAPTEGDIEVEKAEFEAVQKDAADTKAAVDNLTKILEGFKPDAIAQAVSDQVSGKLDGIKSDVEKQISGLGERIAKIEAQPVVPSGTRLKVVEKGQELELQKGNSGAAGDLGQDGLAKATARFAEIQKQLRVTSADDPGREDLVQEGFKLAREIKIATGQPVWR